MGGASQSISGKSSCIREPLVVGETEFVIEFLTKVLISDEILCELHLALFVQTVAFRC